MESIDRKKVGSLILSILVAALATFLLLSFLSASPTVAIGSAQAGSVLCLDTSDTLEELVGCIYDYMPHSFNIDNRDGFITPTLTEMTQWRQVVGQMMEGECDAINLSGYDWGNDFTVNTFTDTQNNNSYCVFMETTYDTYPDPAGVRVTHGWGTFIYNPTYCRELNVSAPHAKFEKCTAVEAVGIFKNTRSRTFLMTGAHRYASDVDSSCQSDYKRSDAAHNTDHMFHATVEALKEYYESQNSSFYHLQFHGMVSCCTNCDVYLSHGVIIPPKPGDKILVLSDTLSAYHPDWRIGVPGDGVCDLNGTKNVQGRLLNGVPGNQVCDIPASSYSGYFIHIEQCLGEPPCLEYRNPANWFPAINDTWPPHLTVTKQASPNPVPTGAQLTYTIHVTNTGEACATGVVITDALPADTQFDSASNGGSEDNGIVTWTVPSISAGSSTSVTFTVTVNTGLLDGTVLTNSGYSVTCTEWLTPITGPDVTTTVRSPILTIAKQASPDPVAAGTQLTYTLTVTNTGGADATGVVITDALPADTQFDSASNGGREENGIITWTSLIVTSNASLPVTFAVSVPCTIDLSITNNSYRVVTSAQGIASGWGAPVTTMVTTPTITVSFSPTSAHTCPNQLITFTDTSATNGGPIVTWSWDFGDGITSTLPHPTHTYTATGSFTVALTVTDTCGFSRTEAITNAVRVGRCVYLPIITKNYP